MDVLLEYYIEIGVRFWKKVSVDNKVADQLI